MGARHNRKRTRSRPRHRHHNSNNHSRNSSVNSVEDGADLPFTSIHPSAAHWDQQYLAWQARIQMQKHYDDALEVERLRLFGGEAGDEVSLCEPMLRVVLDLFNDIDYEDP